MIMQILTHTPLWVFGLLIVLIVFGIKQSRSRNVHAVLAYVMPLGMMALSLAGINSSFGLKPAPMAMWAIALLVVTVIGYRYFRDDRVTFARASRTFFIPGSWVPLCVIMAIFVTKYLFAVMRAYDAQVVASPNFVIALCLAYGCFSGYFAARVVNLVFKARGTAPQV
jgi:hypothetical protein